MIKTFWHLIAIFFYSNIGLSQQINNSEINLNLQEEYNISLVFVSENLKSPVSYFGHNFILFHKQDIPEPDSILIEFSGVISDPLLDHLKALFYYIPGYYKLSRYQDKKHEYLYENRDFYFYRLNLSPDQKKVLINKTKQIIKNNYKYNFINKNCAYYINNIISEILNECDLNDFINLPISTTQNSCISKYIKNSTYLPSTQKISNTLTKDLSSEEEIKIRNLLNGTINFKNLETSKEFNTALNKAINYSIYNEAEPDKRNWLFKLKKEIVFDSEVNVQPLIYESNFLKKDLVSFFQVSKSNLGINFTYSPFQRNFITSKNDFLRSSYLDFSNIKISITNENEIYLRHFKLFSLDIIRPKNSLIDEHSSLFELFYENPKNVITNNMTTNEVGARIGIGKAFGTENIDFGITPFLQISTYQVRNSNLYLNFGLKSRLLLFFENNKFEIAYLNKVRNDLYNKSSLETNYIYQIKNNFSLGFGILGTDLNNISEVEFKYNYLF